MLRHALAPVNRRASDALMLPRTLAHAREQQAIALTFDDGPHPQGTPRILDILAAHAATATFFVIGENVERHPQLARRVLDAGHAIALHGHVHRLQLRRTATALARDYARGLSAIAEATGATPAFHRPPYGIYSSAGLAIARRSGLRPLLWSAWGKDWRRWTTPERIAARAVAGIRAGDVILLHDADFYSARRSHERTAAALPLILSRLREAGIGTVSGV
jgi:peptidoglycan/xylan/chitin deacetylase (PgdA/CDA1 family)